MFGLVFCVKCSKYDFIFQIVPTVTPTATATWAASTAAPMTALEEEEEEEESLKISSIVRNVEPRYAFRSCNSG